MATARLFISTDMQMITGVNHTAGDKDDVQSLVHALMYQDKFDIVGIASSTSWWQPGANNESFIHHVIDKYGQEQSVLAQHGDGFKSASALHDITYQGTQALAGASGIPDRTEASDAIIQQAREADAAGEKLYVATWGGLGDMARALHDAPEIAGAVRLLSVAGEQQEPNAYKYVLENFAGKGDLWWVNENSTHFGVYATPESTGSEQTDPAGNIWAETNARGHGVLGQFFYENTLDILGTNYPGDGLKMGDSHTVFYLIDGEANNDDPTSGSWGGEFQQAGDKYWIDQDGQGFGWAGSEGAMTIYEDRAAWTGDFAARFDWLQAPTPDPVQPTPDPVVAPPTGNGGGGTSDTIGSGEDSIVLHISQDAYQGDAQYTVSVDGQQIGGTLSASALHVEGTSDTLTIRGTFSSGQHTVEVSFLNDLWVPANGGSDGPDMDRNLHVDGVIFNGVDTQQGGTLFSAGGQQFVVGNPGVTPPKDGPIETDQPSDNSSDPWAAFTHDGAVDWAAASAAVMANYEATGSWYL